MIRHWVDHHWYDFESDDELLERTREFLHKANTPALKKWVDSGLKVIYRKEKCGEVGAEQKEITFTDDPPPIEMHLESVHDFDLMTIHPIEIARQVTLLEFDLYRAVRPNELIEANWTKKDKDRRSPQLLKLIRHSNKVSAAYFSFVGRPEFIKGASFRNTIT